MHRGGWSFSGGEELAKQPNNLGDFTFGCLQIRFTIIIVLWVGIIISTRSISIIIIGIFSISIRSRIIHAPCLVGFGVSNPLIFFDFVFVSLCSNFMMGCS